MTNSRRFTESGMKDSSVSKVKLYLPHQFSEIIHSYLSNRILQVKENGATSEFQDIKTGVPQGSVLGPVLYTIFTADLPKTDGVTTATYAMTQRSWQTILTQHSRRSSYKRALIMSQSGLKWRIKASVAKSAHITFALRK